MGFRSEAPIANSTTPGRSQHHKELVVRIWAQTDIRNAPKPTIELYANLRNPKTTMGLWKTYRRLTNAFTRSFFSNHNSKNAPKSVPTRKTSKPPLMASQALKERRRRKENLPNAIPTCFWCPNFVPQGSPTILGEKPSLFSLKNLAKYAKLSPKIET